MARRALGAEPSEAMLAWAENQRALARALGLSIEDWLKAVDAASTRTTGLTAAVVGAAMARGLGMSVLDGLDGAELRMRARALIDPRPPRVENPVLQEAIRRANDLGAVSGGVSGASRLKRAKAVAKAADREALPTPVRETRQIGSSASEATPDSPATGPRPAKKNFRPRKARAPMDEEDTNFGADEEDLK